MKLQQLYLGSALTFTLALAGDEGAKLMHRELNKHSGKKEKLFTVDPSSTIQFSRDLRGHVTGNARTKSGKRGESDNRDDHDNDDPNGGEEKDEDDDTSHRDSKSGKSSKKRGPGGKSKSGKSSRHSQDHAATKYYVAPFSCTNKCIDAKGADFGTGELIYALQGCTTNEIMHGNTQQWMLNEHDDMVQVESDAYRGKCIGVNYKPGDGMEDVKDMCHNGVLALLPCEDPATYWYFTGGQLASFFCWTRGYASVMGVGYDEDEEECMDELKAYDSKSKSGNNGRRTQGMNVSIGENFMFVSSNVMATMYQTPYPSAYPTVLDDGANPTENPSENPDPTRSPSYFPTTSNKPSASNKPSEGA